MHTDKPTINDCVQLTFTQHGDRTGQLVAVDNRDAGFEIKRVFYIFGTKPEISRGRHANRKTTEILINVAGESKIRCIDRSGAEKVVHLYKPHTGVIIPKMIWIEMFDFSKDSVLLVICSSYYDRHEHIDNLNDFLEERS